MQESRDISRGPVAEHRPRKYPYLQERCIRAWQRWRYKTKYQREGERSMQKHSCQRRPINLSSGCWHGDCRTELGWMAQRAMRGHSRILQEPVTGKLEAATAAATRRNTEKRERERRWRVRACTLGGTTETEVETKKEKFRTGEEGAEVSISRGDPINDGALSDAFATRFNTSMSLIRKKKFHPIVLLPILLTYRLGTIKYQST